VKKLIHFKNIALIISAMFFVLDRVLKNVALDFKGTVNVIGNIVTFNFVPNYYLAFSWPMSNWLVLILTGIIIFLLAIYIIFLFKKKQYSLIVPLTILFLGGISNLYDRALYGYVIDYLECLSISILNIADILITLSTVWLGWEVLFRKEK
jgi:signal peptidase II